MASFRYDSNYDTVVAMDEFGVKTEDILHYAHAFLSKPDIHKLVEELQSLLEEHCERNPEFDEEAVPAAANATP
ncbi:MAG: hypothetical protein MK538_11345 [Planctomycetes bacterium]|nr:hypothetical protein [Planctomycetota bacterium]